MIRKLLIANRGEIASRVIRTAKRMGIRTVAVHSEADARALHVGEADEHVDIGPAAARDSYLKIEQILRAAQKTNADAVHPGYGFLSENADFAKACRTNGLVFVGPQASAIEAMASKVAARQTAKLAGVPLLPGTEALSDLEQAQSEAVRLGFPLLLKASGGGGGIGMQIIKDANDLTKHFQSTQDKAQRFFNDAAVYLEKLLEKPRHIEIQIAGDEHGNIVHLGERECSIQRRHQKVIEETPSPGVSPDMREKMAAAALSLAHAVKYSSLGTVEMLVSGEEFYFLEMNTRLQVEHTVTEMVTGLDLVEWQLRVAMGESLPARQQDIRFHGHAFQCRIYAENPAKGFLPSPGQVTRFLVPDGPGVRNDVGVVQGDFVTPYYDPMIAKLIVHGPTRDEAVERLAAALADYQVEGLATNIEMHRQVVAHPVFKQGHLSTDFLKTQLGLKT